MNESLRQIDAMTPKNLDRAVEAALSGHYGEKNRITRQSLIYQVFGVSVPANQLANSRLDRMIRRSIARLQRKMPSLSDSSKGGYWIGTPDELKGYLSELQSRQVEIGKKIFLLKHHIKTGQMSFMENL
jgi:hypothetical protein